MYTFLFPFFKDLKKPTKENILKQIRYEFKHRDRISRDILIDSQAAKSICEHLCIHPSKEGELKGFVQQINQDPYGMLLTSSIQVKEIYSIKIIYFIIILNFNRSKCGIKFKMLILFGILMQPVAF